MPAVIMYSTGFCPYCVRARMLLDRKGVTYIDIRVDNEPALRAEMIQRSGRTSVPQIFIDGRAIGGSDDLHALERSGELDRLLAAAPGE